MAKDTQTQLSGDGKSSVTIIAGKPDSDYWLELWRFKELFAALAWRDISVRYKQTVIGFLWAILLPLMTTFLLTFIFGRVAKLPSEGAAPYALLVLAGLLPWQLFSTSLTSASASLTANSNMVRKIYFPRLVLPLSAGVVSVVDFAISLTLLAAVMFYFNFVPSWPLFALPIFVGMAALSSMSLGIFISALNVKYRDFRYIIPFIVQFGLYISPVGFSSNVIPEEYKLLFYINPMAGTIDGFRWAILGEDSSLYLPGIAISSAVLVTLLVFGVSHFRRNEKNFADYM